MLLARVEVDANTSFVAAHINDRNAATETDPVSRSVPAHVGCEDSLSHDTFPALPREMSASLRLRLAIRRRLLDRFHFNPIAQRGHRLHSRRRKR
jgi:hypothetical protein